MIQERCQEFLMPSGVRQCELARGHDGSHRSDGIRWAVENKTNIIKKLPLTDKEASFLLVLLNERETIERRMKEIGFNIEQVDQESLIAKVRTLCWAFHQEGKG